MSAVRMCDRCGIVFPEGIDGSTVGMGIKMRVVDGRRIREEVQQDQCATCAEGNIMPQFPQAAPTKAIATKVDPEA